MASALHIYANLLWRDNRVDARIKKVAALRLLQEPHYRLHLDELSQALISGHGSSIPAELLAPDQLADILSADSCFVHNESTGNVLVDAASLMAAGKDCLKTQIDRVWDSSTPLSWARNQLAWYIVSRQHIEMRPPDLFLAPVDDAESFLAAAWTARMDLREHSDHPYSSLRQLLGGESRLEMTPDRNGIRLNFHKLLQQPQQESNQSSPVPAASQQHLLQPGGVPYMGNGHDMISVEAGGGTAAEWGLSDSGEDGGGEAYGGKEAAVVAAAAAALQRVGLSQRLPNGGDVEVDGAEEAYDDVEDYGDGADEYDEDDGTEVRGHATRNVGGSAAPVTSRYGNGDAAAAAAGGGSSASASTRPIWPLRPDLLPQYIRAVFASSGASQDLLMAMVALALVDAGRGTGIGSNRIWQVPSSGPGNPDGHRFCLPLPLLVTHIMETAPHLMPPASALGGPWHANVLMQRLREWHSRGCFRVVLPGGGGGGGGMAGETGQYSSGDGGGDEEGEEAVLVVLDLDVLRERVIEALTAAALAVFAGSRPVDEIRRTAAIHLATRTRPFAGRVHCVRLSTLARALAEQLPPEVFDPTRLSGFERLVGSESSSNVMHVFRKIMPGGLAGLSQGHGEEVGTFVTLNLGKLLAAAGVRELEGVPAMRSARSEGRSGDGGNVMGWGGRDTAPSAAAVAAAAASRAAAFAAASANVHSAREVQPPPPPPPAHAHGGGSLPPPPSDAALRRAVEALFPVPDGGRTGGNEYAVVAAAAKRTAALSLVKALHTQQGGFLPMSRLTDIVESVMAGAPDLEQLLASEPDFFEIKEAWYGGPRSVRLRSSAVMAKVAVLGNVSASPSTTIATNSANHSHMASGVSESLPRRPNTLNCPYYMRHGTCGFGAACKYNHPPLTPRQPMEPAPPPPAPAAPAAAAAGLPRSAAAATTNYRPQPQPGQLHAGAHLPGSTATASSAAASVQTTNDGSSAAGGGGGGGGGVPRLSPPSLEVKVVTTACTPTHLDMLQHCYAAPQVAVACKVRHVTYPHMGSSSGVDVGQVCLVQLYAPAVAAAGGGGGAGAAGGATHGSGSEGAGSSAATTGGSSGSGSTTRWQATVYLVDPAAGEDRKGLLLPSLSALLEDPAVPKVVYCGNEVVPFMPRISPLHDISILHAVLTRAPHAVLGPVAGAPEVGAVIPPLAALLQQHRVMTAAGAAAAAVAPAHSPLWANRPLADELRQQAVLEVVHLASLWTGLMTRLAALPQQLSQAAADRMYMEHSERSASAASAAVAAGASVAAAANAQLMHPAARAPAVAVPAGVAVLVPAVPVPAPGSGAPQQRIGVNMHRIW